MSSPLAKEFWDKIADNYEGIFLPRHIKLCIPDIVNMADANNFFEELSAKEKEPVILDIGTGTGFIISALLYNNKLMKITHCAKIIVTDYAHKMLAIAKSKFQNLPYKFQFLTLDCQDMSQDISSDSIDLAFASFVYMYVPDRQAAYKELLRVLKKGGKYVVSIYFLKQ